MAILLQKIRLMLTTQLHEFYLDDCHLLRASHLERLRLKLITCVVTVSSSRITWQAIHLRVTLTPEEPSRKYEQSTHSKYPVVSAARG